MIPLIVDVDRIEEEMEKAPEPGEDIIILPIPIPLYKKLSDAAALRNMTIAQLLARAIAIAVEER